MIPLLKAAYDFHQIAESERDLSGSLLDAVDALKRLKISLYTFQRRSLGVRPYRRWRAREKAQVRRESQRIYKSSKREGFLKCLKPTQST